MTRSRFLLEYVRNVREVGAVAPSSVFLARKMCETIDFEHAKTIVEYGPGTGVFTDELLRRAQPETTLVLIESNSAFYDKLAHKYKANTQVKVVHDSAENVETILRQLRLPLPDYVVSGLPFAALPSKVSHKILDSTAKLLKPNGSFITFQYTLFKRELIAGYFNAIGITRELRNIPPAYVLTCKNKKN